MQDHEIAFSFPYTVIGEILEGLEATHKVGTRYPLTNWMNYTAAFPPSYDGYRGMLDEAGPPDQGEGGT